MWNMDCDFSVQFHSSMCLRVAATMWSPTASVDPTATALIASATSESWTVSCNTRVTFSVVVCGR